MPSINNFLQGFQDGLPGMKDYQHASRLYVDDNFKLMPKQKFLFHVVFNTDESLFNPGFAANEKLQLNMLVKACDLPKYNLSYEEKTQYNKKMYLGTRIAYDPVNITFHDDHADTVNAFWKKYYEYHIADSVSMNTDLAISATKDDYYNFKDQAQKFNKFGMDTPRERGKPYLKGIEIFVLHKKRFTSMTLVNPVIGSFSHDNLDQADGTGVMSNSMQILYETVIYKAGVISRDAVKGFATINYDQSPSPLSILGGGTNSIFGPGGIVDGVGSVIKNYKQGNILGAILGASNTYNNAKKIKKSNVKQELKGIAKKGVLEIGKQSSNITNPIARFTVGATAIANASSISQLAGTADNKDKANSRVIKQSNVDTVNFLGESESFNLVSNDENVRDEVAAALYFRDVGSRKGLTIAQSNIEYEGSSDNIKSVYSNKAITDMRKLVTEGYIRIPRNSKDVQIVVEKATI